MIKVIETFLSNYDDIIQVIVMSLFVSITSTFIAAILGVVPGIYASLYNFKLKKFIMNMAGTLMSLPPVLMGLLVYMLLSRKGPLGKFELLFTPSAMIIAQTLLIIPIIFVLTVSTISKFSREIQKTCLSLGAGRVDTIKMIIKESRGVIISAITTGFGRALSEVGAVMMVGGNIKGFTRVMTTYIALETGKGNFNEALIIGLILLFISFMINVTLLSFRGK